MARFALITSPLNALTVNLHFLDIGEPQFLTGRTVVNVVPLVVNKGLFVESLGLLVQGQLVELVGRYRLCRIPANRRVVITRIRASQRR